MANKVSGKTHTKAQLDNYANQHNPNNKAYKANVANQNKTHQQKRNAHRRSKDTTVYWAPDYPEYND